VLDRLYRAAEFLDAARYAHVCRWARTIDERPATQRALRVNRNWGESPRQLPERHDSRDFAFDPPPTPRRRR
jgi:GST-like protein